MNQKTSDEGGGGRAVSSPAAYDPKAVEEYWLKFWLEKNLFHAEASSKKPPFCIVIPPPNVTGSLHMGHALNSTLQDILSRYKRMTGFNVLWLPGTDHAGIATQNVVERELAKEGKKRQDLGREKFIEEVWKWKEKHGNHIVHQLKRLGASCDWERERFTMDEGLSRAVKEAFVGLYEKGLIYRDLYLINWCPRCLTALSDLEVEHQEQEGSLWFIRYPVGAPLGAPMDGAQQAAPVPYITVATTRPETMLGDTAVAVHPEDERYKKLIGKMLEVPLTGRKIPIIADHRVDREFGTGAVKVTPAHDFNDFIFGNDHKLPRLNIFTPDAKMNENAGAFQGLDRFAARKAIVQELEDKGFLEKTDKHKLSVGHCYRCKTVVEPYLSLQWFVKVGPLAQKALEAVKKKETKFHPENWTKTYEQWMENIKDWCISRQIWWGHRIPAWYCIPPQPPLTVRGGEGEICPPIVSKETPQKCPKCGGKNLRQEEDVLDTWFSSALWPFSTLGWPDKTPELKTFYPTSVLVTGFDIIFFWVARMMMMGLEFMNDVPFKDVYIHALVRDAEGKKMSKSKGNVIDPLSIMDKFGTDAFRFTLASLAAQGRDIKLSEEVIEGYRNFCNKIWNGARFSLSKLEGLNPPIPPLSKGDEGGFSNTDRWVLVQWDKTLAATREAIEGYHFDEAAKGLYQFFWHIFCDWYLEFSKVKFNPQVLAFVLESSLRALHPFIPFITEEIGHKLPGISPDESLAAKGYPEVSHWKFDDKNGEKLLEVITALRTVRGENNIPIKAEIAPLFATKNAETKKLLESESDLVSRLTGSRKAEWPSEKVTPKKMAHMALADLDIYVPLEGIVDIASEIKRLEKEIGKLKEDGVRREKRLSDENFTSRALPEIVAEERVKLKELQTKCVRLEETLKNIS
jgi:valyl-tRNA synthetase